MPDRPRDLEPGVRDALDDMASEAAAPRTAPPSVLRVARRRLARNATAVVLAVSVLTAGSIAAVQLAAGSGGTPRPIGSGSAPTPGPTTGGTNVTPTPAPSESTTLPPGGGAKGPMPLMTFLDGVVYRYSPAADGSVGEAVGQIPEATAAQPPVATPHGVLVLGGRPGRGTDLWLIDDQGARRLLASNLDGFAVSADGQRVAYAKVDTTSTSADLVEASLPTGTTLHSTAVDTYARVVGYAADVVVMDTGDGAAASAAVWSPGASSINRLTGYGRALASDPESGVAVLTQGDGVCWSIAWLGPTGNAGAPPPKPGNGCGISGVSIERGGGSVAGVILTSESRSGPQRFVLQGTDSELGAAVTLDGAFQTWWHGAEAGAPTIFVMAESTPGTYAVYRCRVSEATCPSDPLWTGSAPDVEGSAWLVEERAQQSG